MILVPRDASDEEVLDIVRAWVDLLAQEDYQTAFAHIGSWAIRGEWTPEFLEYDIKRYRSPEFYPGVEEFTVTDWRTAQGGNPEPMQEVVWYTPTENFPLVGSISIDLPLNGRWSDLRADFVLFKNETLDEDYILGLEELYSWRQSQRDFEAWEQQEAAEAGSPLA